MKGHQRTGDHRDAIARADAAQAVVASTAVIAMGLTIMLVLQVIALNAARKAERAEAGFQLDVAGDALHRQQTIHVDRAGEATRGEPEQPPPTEEPS